MVAAFNALLTSLDAKLPTSRFTADELRISNGRGRRSRCKLHSLPGVPACYARRLSSAELRRGRVRPAFRISLVRGNGHVQKTAVETKVGVNRDWRAMKHFRAALVIYYDVAGTFPQLARRFSYGPRRLLLRDRNVMVLLQCFIMLQQLYCFLSINT